MDYFLWIRCYVGHLLFIKIFWQNTKANNISSGIFEPDLPFGWSSTQQLLKNTIYFSGSFYFQVKSWLNMLYSINHFFSSYINRTKRSGIKLMINFPLTYNLKKVKKLVVHIITVIKWQTTDQRNYSYSKQQWTFLFSVQNSETKTRIHLRVFIQFGGSAASLDPHSQDGGDVH